MNGLSLVRTVYFLYNGNAAKKFSFILLASGVRGIC
jgi:hypothetical protein